MWVRRRRYQDLFNAAASATNAHARLDELTARVDNLTARVAELEAAHTADRFTRAHRDAVRLAVDVADLDAAVRLVETAFQDAGPQLVDPPVVRLYIKDQP